MDSICSDVFSALVTIPETHGFSPLAASGGCIFAFYPLSEVMVWQDKSISGWYEGFVLIAGLCNLFWGVMECSGVYYTCMRMLLFLQGLPSGFGTFPHPVGHPGAFIPISESQPWCLLSQSLKNNFHSSRVIKRKEKDKVTFLGWVCRKSLWDEDWCTNGLWRQCSKNLVGSWGEGREGRKPVRYSFRPSPLEGLVTQGALEWKLCLRVAQTLVQEMGERCPKIVKRDLGRVPHYPASQILSCCTVSLHPVIDSLSEW